MIEALGSRLLATLRAQREQMIGLLRDLTVTESPSGQDDALRRVIAVLAPRFENMGFHTATTGLHFYARPRERQRNRGAQLLLGHYDTVWPLGTLQDMPFTVEGDIVRGPGVFDMKGGLTQMVFALEALASLDQPIPLTPVIFVNADEEIGSRSSGRYIRMLARRVQRAYVLEPSLGPRGKLKTRRKGIGRYTVKVFGQAAHAGLDPEGGASAILELSFLIQKLFALNDPQRGISVNVGTIDGGIRPNVIAPHSQAVVDVRVASAEDAEKIDRIIHGLQSSRPEISLRVEGGIGRPALEQTPRNLKLWNLALSLGQDVGLELEQASAGGGSDGNTTSQYTATLDGLGPVGDGAHAHHEYLDIEQTIQRTALLALLIRADTDSQEAAA